MKITFLKFYNLIRQDSLYKNSIFLMLNTGIMAIVGFLFWIISARLYSTVQVGLATTLISIMKLLSTISILGLGDGLIRFLPGSEVKNRKINTSFFLVSLSSVFVSIIFLVLINYFSPTLIFIRESILFSLLFIFFVTLSSLNDISENIFVAYRSSRFLLLKNTLPNLLNLFCPLFLYHLGLTEYLCQWPWLQV